MAASASAKITRIAALVACLSLSLALSAAWAAAPPKPGTPAPAFSLPVVVNGHGTLSLASLHGRGVYLNFFASWCEPCKAEVPAIVTLSKQYAKRNVVVVGIDELESADKAEQFAHDYGMSYPVVIDGSGNVGGAYGLYGMPVSVFIAPNGTVTEYHVGQLSNTKMQSALQSISSGHS